MPLSPKVASKLGDWYANSQLEPGPQYSAFAPATEGDGLLASADTTAKSGGEPSGNPILDAYLSSGNQTPLPADEPTDESQTEEPVTEEPPPETPPPVDPALPTSEEEPEIPTGTPRDDEPTRRRGPIPDGLLHEDDLARRTVGTDETVEGRMTGLLSSNSQYLQQARDRTRREGASRGLLNSSISASAGEEAAIAAALPIASADAATYGRAADYNAALHNQAAMYNADTVNRFLEQANSLSSSERIAALQSMTQREIAATQAHVQQQVAAQQAAASVANAQAAAAASRYGADSQQAIAAANNAAALQRQLEASQARLREIELQNQGNLDANNAHDQTVLINNIINNPDIPPEVRDRLLRQLGRPDLAVLFDNDPDLTPPGNTSGNALGRYRGIGSVPVVDDTYSGG